MTYSPSESEKRTAAFVQALAAVFLFLPPLIVWRMRIAKVSPYLKYWTKVCLMWSFMSAIAIAVSIVISRMLDVSGPTVILATIHFVVCVVGAMSSYFNTPFCYWFTARFFCDTELSDIYGQLTSRRRMSER